MGGMGDQRRERRGVARSFLTLMGASGTLVSRCKPTPRAKRGRERDADNNMTRGTGALGVSTVWEPTWLIHCGQSSSPRSKSGAKQQLLRVAEPYT